MYLRIFYRCILIQHSDTYIFSGHVRGDQDLGMQLIAAHLQANLRFIALQFTKLCKTVIQTISSVTASQHHSTFRPREQLAPVLLHDWSDNVSRSADQVGEAAGVITFRYIQISQGINAPVPTCAERSRVERFPPRRIEMLVYFCSSV